MLSSDEPQMGIIKYFEYRFMLFNAGNNGITEEGCRYIMQAKELLVVKL